MIEAEHTLWDENALHVASLRAWKENYGQGYRRRLLAFMLLSLANENDEAL